MSLLDRPYRTKEALDRQTQRREAVLAPTPSIEQIVETDVKPPEAQPENTDAGV